MPEQIDRYPSNPLNGAAQMRDWMREVDRRVSALEGAPQWGVNSQTVDTTGTTRVLQGLLSDGTYGLEIDGGKVQAIQFTGDSIVSTNASTLTTIAQTILTLTFIPPAWAVHALAMGWATVEVTDTTAAANVLIGQVSVDGVDGQRSSQSSTSGQTTSVTPVHARNLSAPLANPIDVHAEAYLAAGTNASNRFSLVALVLYTR